MPRLEIRLLGSPQIRLGNEPLTSLRSDKVRALLAYLAVEADQPHRREKLAGLLWPGYPESSARASLRRALADLRMAVKDNGAEQHFLWVTRQTIQFDRTSDAWVDAVAFESQINHKEPLDEATIARWEEAVELYQGNFLDGFSLADSPAFEEWVVLNREQLKRRMVETLERLGECLEERGEYERGLAHMRRAVELEPLRESAQRGLMRLLATNGQRELALAQYDVCTHNLSSELGVEPSSETRQLYERVLNGEWPPVPSSDAEISHRPPRSISESPYRGLAAFREQDAAFFFGREDFTQQLLDALQAPWVVAAIIGPSGSGKSSVAYAGLLPQLREQGAWIIVHFRPGPRPYYSLTAALLPVLEWDLSEADRLIESQKLADALMQGDISLSQIIDRLLEVNGKDRCLLLIDQFEELYTLCTEQTILKSFLDEIFSSVENEKTTQKSPLALLLTMRSDFITEALSYRPFADALQHGSLMLGPMTREELRAAIEKPADVQGAAFEEGLVARILDDVARQPGSLPLLEFALTLLWEGISSGWLTHAVYESIGGVQGALARYAEQVYSELGEQSCEEVQRIFSQLVRPGEGTVDTRRVATRPEIGSGNWSLVRHLADKRLVVTGTDESGNEIVEIVHEALIGNWERLRGWVEADRAFRTWQERLRSAISQWQISQEEEGALLRGAPLAEAEAWLVEKEDYLSQQELSYIHASVALRESSQAEQERSRRRIMIGLSIGLVVTLVLSIFAGWQWYSAQQAQVRAEAERDQTRIALSRSLATQAKLMLDEELDLATLLSIEAVNIAPSVESRGSLLSVLAEQPRLATILHGHRIDVQAVATSPDGRLLATGDTEGGLLLYKFSGADAPILADQTRQLSGHIDMISSLAFSPDGRLLASGGFDDSIYLWDVATGEQVNALLNRHRDNIWAIAFSPDGHTLASGGADGQVLFWDVESGLAAVGLPNERLPVAGSGIVSSLTFSPDGGILAVGMGDGSVALWDMSASEPIGEPLAGHDRLVRALVFSPDGSVLASAGDDSRIVLWNAQRDSTSFLTQLGEPLDAHEDWVTDLAFSADLGSLISAGKDGLVYLWDLEGIKNAGGRRVPRKLLELKKPVWSFAYSPDGRWLVTGGEEDASVWDLSQLHPLAYMLGKHSNWVSDLAFSPNNQLLASADTVGFVILWDMQTGQPVLPAWKADDYGVISLDFSPHGSMLATAGVDDQIRIWDADPASETFGEALRSPLLGHARDVTAVAFHPDGKFLVSGDENGSIMIWDMDRESANFGEQLARPEAKNAAGIRDLIIDPSGEILIAFSSVDVTIWDISKNPPGQIQGFVYSDDARWNLPVYNLIALDPDVSILIMAIQKSLRIFDLNLRSATFSELLEEPIEEYSGRLFSINVSPDYRMLASGDEYGRLQLWDMISWLPLGPPLTAHDTDIYNLSFNQSGSILVSGDSGGNLVVWNLDLGSWIDIACRRANRNLTQQEWQRYFGDEPYRATCPELPLEPEGFDSSTDASAP